MILLFLMILGLRNLGGETEKRCGLEEIQLNPRKWLRKEIQAILEKGRLILLRWYTVVLTMG